MTRAAENCGFRGQPAHADLLEEAFAQSQSELLGTLYFLLGNFDDARDALQDTFLKCWRHQEQLDEVRNLRAWIFRIALNTGRDLRQAAWRRKRQPLADGEAMIEDRRDSPSAQAAHSEQMERVRGALRDLRSEEREVFLLRQNGDMTYEEIADALGIPTGTVKTRMRRALCRLRQALAES